MRTRVGRALAITWFTLAASAGHARLAHAAPSTGTVEGDVGIPSTVEAPKPKYVGFIEQPILNPITEPRPFDPRPEVFVWLEGTAATPEAAQPPKNVVVWPLGSHSFSPPLLPVVTGSTVQLSNQGRETHLLQSADAPVPNDPIGPGSSRDVTVTGDKVVRVGSKDVPHLEGRIVPVKTRYYSRINRDGSFKITDVPHGDWTLRIWYRDGWITKTYPVTVGNKTPRLKVELPEQLEPKPVAETAPAQPAAPAAPK